MSALAKSVFFASCVGAIGIVAYVHWKQVLDRQYLHEGILRDIERQEKKRENLENLQAQIELTKRYQEAMANKQEGNQAN